MLNQSKGNMYGWVTHTWNTIKGECSHDCVYCYMKRFGQQRAIRFDEKELKTDLGTGNRIFVGSSCDMFAADVPGEWISKTLEHCRQYDSEYLLQTKNPERFIQYIEDIPERHILCTTIECDRQHNGISSAPAPYERAGAMSQLSYLGFKTSVTIEPIMDFDHDELIAMVAMARPAWVSIGANTAHWCKLPEPTPEKVRSLIQALSQFTDVIEKDNLKRLLKG